MNPSSQNESYQLRKIVARTLDVSSTATPDALYPATAKQNWYVAGLAVEAGEVGEIRDDLAVIWISDRWTSREASRVIDFLKELIAERAEVTA